jgi:hypothetical protein
MNAVQNRRLGTEYEVGLWHALTGIPVRVFRQQANGTWHEQAFYHQYTVDQQAERWIGYIGDGQNGHWVELQNGATLNGGIQLRMSSNDGNSTGGAGSGASGTSGFFGGIFGSLWPASR